MVSLTSLVINKNSILCPTGVSVTLKTFFAFISRITLIRNAITSARLKPEYTSDDYVFTMIIIKNPKKEAKTI